MLLIHPLIARFSGEKEPKAHGLALTKVGAGREVRTRRCASKGAQRVVKQLSSEGSALPEIAVSAGNELIPAVVPWLFDASVTVRIHSISRASADRTNRWLLVLKVRSSCI